MKKLAIVFHSGFGHTAFFAKAVAEGMSRVSGVEVQMLKTDDLMKTPEALLNFDGIVWGSPTYMGSVSGPFKTFMDATGGLWQKGALKDKWSGGFTVSGSPSGDKQGTLMTMAVFAAQHGMLWVGSHIIPETYAGVAYDQAANRLGSFLGVMAQAAPVEPEKAFVEGDLKTARMFGERFAQIVAKHS
jgi:multimeric flavodoxin WrbA